MNGLSQTDADVRVITIDYGKTLAEMIAAGRYDRVNGSITTTRFPPPRTGIATYEAKPFHSDRFISSVGAVDAIQRDGWWPAKIEHLLAFDAVHPDAQRKHPIVALGSTSRVFVFRFVPYLDGRGSSRDLLMDWWRGGWPACFRFLGVRSIPPLGI